MQPATIREWFDRTCTLFADKKAITFVRDGVIETILTYAELKNSVYRFAGILSQRGLSRQDRVILHAEKSVHTVVAHLALQILGAVAIPLNPGFKNREMTYLLKDAAAGLILTDSGRGERIRRIDPDVRLMEIPTHLPFHIFDDRELQPVKPFDTVATPEDAAIIIYTSGTTGDPKGAILTHQNLVNDAANIINIWKIGPNDTICHALPLFHVHGLCFALQTGLLSGAHIMMLNRFDPKTVLGVLAAKDESCMCTVFMAVPAMYTALLDVAESDCVDFKHLRLLTSGSAPLPVRQFERIRACFGMEPVEREGMSETGMNFSNPLEGVRKPGSIGLPLPGVSVRIVDPVGFEDVTSGEIGEIWLKSASISPGYWRKPRETSDTFKDGWFRTGDLGRVDEHGYYYLTDRIKHIIISGGENVSAKEVETVIERLDGVKESAVVGIADPKWGEMVVAAVVKTPESPLGAEDIILRCKTELHAWKCPKQVRFVAELPRNTMGKILKEEVKKIFVER